MGYYIEHLKRPYDFRVLIEAYISTRRDDFVHPDFKEYYAALLECLESLFCVRLSRDALTLEKQANATSETAHREMLYALFTAIFGERSQVVTSEELQLVGFDDSKEPDMRDYYDYL